MQIREFSGEEFDEISSEFFMPAVVRRGLDFRVRVALQELDTGLTLSRVHWGGPRSTTRTNRMAARASDASRMLFAVQEAGRGHMTQCDRFAELAPGTGFLTEACSPATWVSQTETERLILSFSRELLPLRAAEITEGCARSMNSASPAMQTLSAYLGRFFEIADDLTAPQRLDAGRAGINLLAMALRDVVPSVPGGDGPAGVLLEMMLTHVRKHLTDPELRVEELARRHYVSVRRVYNLFERIGTTPGAYLREQRLLAAQTMLTDPRYDRLSVSSIATAVGLLDLGTFERAFRRQYGMTPARWRREHRHSGSAPPTGRNCLPR
ncbi:hypothetical protein GCM10010464_40910 [Pseudonocardia yunnanensis]|uniref:Helix-turn-helix domain-containing protein n=1 Tax=Pseudonocardia yunnanensis TaxID=58107 RepID=A0ABW4F7S2_9PSEU